MNIRTKILVMCLLVSGMSLQAAARHSAAVPRHKRTCWTILLGALVLSSGAAQVHGTDAVEIARTRPASATPSTIPFPARPPQCTHITFQDDDGLHGSLSKLVMGLPYSHYDQNTAWVKGFVEAHRPFMNVRRVALESVPCHTSCTVTPSDIECRINALHSARQLKPEHIQAPKPRAALPSNAL